MITLGQEKAIFGLEKTEIIKATIIIVFVIFS